MIKLDPSIICSNLQHVSHDRKQRTFPLRQNTRCNLHSRLEYVCATPRTQCSGVCVLLHLLNPYSLPHPLLGTPYLRPITLPPPPPFIFSHCLQQFIHEIFHCLLAIPSAAAMQKMPTLFATFRSAVLVPALTESYVRQVFFDPWVKEHKNRYRTSCPGTVMAPRAGAECP